MIKLLIISCLLFGAVNLTDVTFYEILGVSKKATAQEIRQAYKKLAVKFHPDKNTDSEEQDKFLKITEAYETLKDPDKRRKYDLYGSFPYTRKYDYHSQTEYDKLYYNGLYHDDPFVDTLSGAMFNNYLKDGFHFINFYSPFCPPCQNVADHWKKLAETYKGIIIYSFVYSLPSYFLSDQPAEFFRFLMFVLTLSNVALLAEAIGHIIGTCVNPINGTFLGAIWTCAMIVYAGFFVLFNHMSPVMRVVSYASFLRHGFEALTLSLYSYGRQPLYCPPTKEYCHMRYPQSVMEQFSFKPDNFWIDILILVSEIISVRILSYFTLRRSIKRSA